MLQCGAFAFAEAPFFASEWQFLGGIVAKVSATQGGKRKALALAIGEDILTATIDVIAVNGPDGLNLSEIARIAGVTTGAVYARYENREELLVDVWVKRAGPALASLFGLTSAAYRGNAAAAAEAAMLLQSSSKLLKVSFALLLVSARIDELAEVIPADMQSWFAKNPILQESLLAIAYVLGAVGFDSIIDAPARDWSQRLAWASQLAAPGPGKRAASKESAEDSLEEIVSPQTGDPVKDSLLTAMALVVARSGLSRATTTRIARAAGCQQSTVFAYWPTRAELVAEWAKVVLAGMVRASYAAGSSAPGGRLGAAIAGLSQVLGPKFKRTRRMRLEILLAGMIQEPVAKAIHSSDVAAAINLAEGNQSLVALMDAQRAVVLGLVVLEESMGGMSELDLAPPIMALLSSALKAQGVES